MSITRFILRGSGLSAARIAVVAASVLAASCASAGGTGLPVRFAPVARTNYDRGVAELEAKGVERARRYFNHVRRQFPYSRYATLAELRLADCEFADKEWAEAAASYRRFLRLHPTHPNVDHAAYRRGLAFYRMIPSDWFLVPPSHERDMSATRDALAEVRAFLREYPESEYAEQATELARDCLRRLARHEMYVARFYLRRGKHRATIGRTEVIERRYPDSGAVPEAIFLRGETYLRMDDPESARQAFRTLAEHYPHSPEAARARAYLRHLGDGSGAARGRAGDPADGEPEARSERHGR